MAVFDKKSAIIWIVASQAVMVVVNFLLLKLMTSELSVASFGYYSLCMTIVLFARQVLYDPISIVVAKNCGAASQDFRRISDEFGIVRFVTDRLGLALLLLGGVAWMLAYWVVDNSVEGVIAWSCFLYLCANGAQGIYFNVLNSIRKRKSAALWSILDSLLKLAFVYFGFWFFGHEVVYALISISTGAFFVFLGARWYVLTSFSQGDLPLARLKAGVRRNFLVSVPLYLPTLLVAFKSVGDRWILAAFIGVDELAAFSVLLQLGYFPMLLLVGIVQTFVAPKIYSLCAIKNRNGRGELKRFLHRLIFGILLFSCISCGVAMLVSDWVFHLFVSEKYSVFSIYLPFFIVSGAFAAAGGVLHVAAIGVFETRVVGKLMILSVLVSIAIVYFFIITWGLVGAIAGLVIASVTSMLLYWVALFIGAFRFAQDES